MKSKYHLNLRIFQKCPRPADERSAAPPSSAASHTDSLPLTDENKVEQKRGNEKNGGLPAHLCALSAVRPHTCTLRGAPIVAKRKGKVGGEPRL